VGAYYAQCRRERRSNRKRSTAGHKSSDPRKPLSPLGPPGTTWKVGRKPITSSIMGFNVAVYTGKKGGVGVGLRVSGAEQFFNRTAIPTRYKPFASWRKKGAGNVQQQKNLPEHDGGVDGEKPLVPTGEGSGPPVPTESSFLRAERSSAWGGQKGPSVIAECSARAHKKSHLQALLDRGWESAEARPHAEPFRSTQHTIRAQDAAPNDLISD